MTSVGDVGVSEAREHLAELIDSARVSGDPVFDRYRVEITRRAVKMLAGLPRREQQRIRAAIDLLADSPRPPGCRPLAGEDDVYRVRVGDYRIVYEVIDRRLIVHAVRVGHRRDVYRR